MAKNEGFQMAIDKLVEAFPDLQVKRATFYRYMKALREQHGYPHASKRKTVFAISKCQ